MKTNLPAQGWMPDPVQPGVLRLRRGGVWTDVVMCRQEPWGPQRFLAPVSLASLHALAS